MSYPEPPRDENQAELSPRSPRARLISALLDGMDASVVDTNQPPTVVVTTVWQIARDNADAIVTEVAELSLPFHDRLKILAHLTERLRADRDHEAGADADNGRALRRGHRLVSAFSTATPGRPPEAIRDDTLRETLVSGLVYESRIAVFPPAGG